METCGCNLLFFVLVAPSGGVLIHPAWVSGVLKAINIKGNYTGKQLVMDCLPIQLSKEGSEVFLFY